MSTKKNRHSKGKRIGLGIAALAAAGAAAYYFYGPKSARNRAKAKKWAGEAQREVVRNLKRLRTVNRTAYNRTVDAVTRRYAALKKASPAEIRTLVREMKGHWRNVSRAAAARKPSRKKARR